MSEARFLLIIFTFDGAAKITELKPEFDKAFDWLRINASTWIVWTTDSPTDWYGRLKPLLGANDDIYILGIDTNIRQGWGPKTAWDWLDKKR